MAGLLMKIIIIIVFVDTAASLECDDYHSCVGTIYTIAGIVFAVLVFIIMVIAVIFGILTMCGYYSGCLKTTYDPRRNRTTNVGVSPTDGGTGIRFHCPPPPSSSQRSNGRIEPYDDQHSSLPPRYSSLEHDNPPPSYTVISTIQTKL